MRCGLLVWRAPAGLQCLSRTAAQNRAAASVRGGSAAYKEQRHACARLLSQHSPAVGAIKATHQARGGTPNGRRILTQAPICELLCFEVHRSRLPSVSWRGCAVRGQHCPCPGQRPLTRSVCKSAYGAFDCWGPASCDAGTTPFSDVLADLPPPLWGVRT